MALFPEDNMRVKDGIQLGGPQTLCYKCEAERRAKDIDSDIPYGKLQYKEVFKITQDGLDICLCMDHFRAMCATSHYALIDTNECMAVPLAVMEDEELAAEEPDPKPEKTVEEAKEEKKEEPKKKAAPKKKEETDK